MQPMVFFASCGPRCCFLQGIDSSKLRTIVKIKSERGWILKLRSFVCGRVPASDRPYHMNWYRKWFLVFVRVDPTANRAKERGESAGKSEGRRFYTKAFAVCN